MRGNKVPEDSPEPPGRSAKVHKEEGQQEVIPRVGRSICRRMRTGVYRIDVEGVECSRNSDGDLWTDAGLRLNGKTPGHHRHSPSRWKDSVRRSG